MKTFTAFRTAAAALGLAAILALTACGGSGGSAQGAASPGGGAAATGNNDQLVEFARCMRGQGVDVPDPKPGDKLMDVFHGLNSKDPKVQDALDACQDKLPDQVKQRATDPAMEDNMLKFAQCMRQNGVEMPDPNGGHPDFGSVDRNSPEFQKAMPKCQSLLTGEGNS
jgi:hypothetical protein